MMTSMTMKTSLENKRWQNSCSHSAIISCLKDSAYQFKDIFAPVYVDLNKHY